MELGGMNVQRVALSVVLAVSAITTGWAGDKPRGVLELFTSQGCSSCPPADQLLGQLADTSVVALSLPIDYWDYLGWKDTLAKASHSARQRAYALLRGDREVYTPQVVVDGTSHVLGSDKVAIEQALVRNAHLGTLVLPVTLTMKHDGLTVSLPEQADEAPRAQVWLCMITKRVSISIGRGENRGRTVTYHNVVRRWTKLGDWNGAAHTFTVPTAELGGADIDTVAVLVQVGTGDVPGRMLGAAIASLH
jgi:hypothetical protein